ncbi:MFS transporter [Kineosporia succinea]|uniref:MFS family permease n=1 Tax=Kineosporia succinea TaxID=84632 RepID=A0ABT9P3P3_9ACTN|nr:MFS transporter [Kineosporia succinea]MDP9826815.1 MFS family permease [Kineosporia succinea]
MNRPGESGATADTREALTGTDPGAVPDPPSDQQPPGDRQPLGDQQPPGDRPGTRTTRRPEPDDRPAGYRDVFGVKEFRALFAADLFSLIGDQVAAVAVAVLLYQDTGSPLLAAAGYATAYVPWLLGGPLLAAWAERFASRSVMVACDLSRALLIAIAAIPGLPSLAVAGLVFLAAMLAPPFDAARSALITQLLPGNKYPVGMSLRQAVHQVAQLSGFALGGALVLAMSAPGVLALNCLTFLASALLLRTFLTARPKAPTVDAAVASEPASPPGEDEEENDSPYRPRRGANAVPQQRLREDSPRVPNDAPSVPLPRREPAQAASSRLRLRGRRATDPRRSTGPGPDASSRTSIWRDLTDGLQLVRGDARIWFPLMLGIVGAAYAIVPEAIATAYATELGHGHGVVGLIMAAAAAGSVAGGLAIGRFAGPRAASRIMYPLALMGTVPLLVVALRPGLVVSLALFAVCGLGQAFQVVANTQFASNVPAEMRTRAFGIAIAGLYGGQSLAILVAGAAAQWLEPSTVIASSGLIGAVGVLLLPHLRPSVLVARGRHTNQG